MDEILIDLAKVGIPWNTAIAMAVLTYRLLGKAVQQ